MCSSIDLLKDSILTHTKGRLSYRRSDAVCHHSETHTSVMKIHSCICLKQCHADDAYSNPKVGTINKLVLLMERKVVILFLKVMMKGRDYELLSLACVPGFVSDAS